MKKSENGRYARNGLLTQALACAVAAAFCAGLPAGVALAVDDGGADEGVTLSQSQSILNSDYKTANKAKKKSLKSVANLPSAMDLRHYNGSVSYDSAKKRSAITGGINYVTPVKKQDPFQDCWAFSVISATETSMLTSLDKADDGEMNGSVDYEKAASGAAGSMAQAASDLSERHLAYCVFTHPKATTAYSDQAGEGRYLLSGDVDAASILNPGGMPLAGVSAFSCGIGPVSESVAPYISDEGYVSLPLPVFDMSSPGFMKQKLFDSYEDAVNYIGVAWNTDSVNAFRKELADTLGQEFVPVDDETAAERIKAIKPSISDKGTWSVDDSLVYESVAELTGSNLLETSSGGGLDDAEIASMKQEISEGHPVSIAFCADQSQPGQAVAGNTYLNTTNWAQYTFETKKVNHGVTIVGYDDDYDKSNFTHDIYKTEIVDMGNGHKAQQVVKDENGNPVVDEEATAKTTPAHNGAWIVKNSWGSSDNSNPMYQEDWGVDGSGYFYLSYEDANISKMESYEFDTSAKAQKRASYVTAEYDISKATNIQSDGFDGECKICNVFNDDGENGSTPYKVRDIGCMTGVAGDTVTLDIYLMDSDEDAATVVSKRKRATFTQTETFEHAGYHRFSLDSCFTIAPGEKVAVVQTTKRPDGQCERTFLYGFTQNLAEAVNTLAGGTVLPTYAKTVVNKGESLEYADGVWRDWSDSSVALSTQLTSDLFDSEFEVDEKTTAEDIAKAKQQAGAGLAIDNFSIKLYADAVSKKAQPVKNATISKTYKAGKSGKLPAAKSFSAKVKGVKDGAKVTYSKVSVACCTPKYFKVSKAGKVTVKKGLAVGAYTLKVKCAIAGTAAYKAKTVYRTCKVRVR